MDQSVSHCRCRWQSVAVCLFFLVLALVYLMPLPLHWGSGIPGDNGDSAHNYWHFWHLPWAVWNGHWSYLVHSPMQLAPDGVDLVFTSNSFIGSALMAPLALAWNPAAALNTWLLLHLWLGGWVFSLFCRRMGAGLAGAVLGGMAYAWMPFIAAHLPGHYNLVQVAWTPLALLGLHCLADACAGGAPNCRRYTGAVLLALGCWGVATTDIYLAIMTLALLLCLLLHLWLRYGRGLVGSGAFWKNLTGAALATGIGLAPWVVAISMAKAHGDYGNPRDLGSGLTFTWNRLVSPPAYHFVWGPRMYGDFQTKGLSVFNEYVYGGVVALLVGFIGLVYNRHWRQGVVWVVAFGVILFLGAENSHTKITYWRPLPLPLGRLWPDVFPFSEFRAPSRWQFALCTIIALLMALGSSALLLRINKASARRVFVAAVGAALLFDLTRWPMPVCPAFVPESGIAPAEAGDSSTVLDFPVGLKSGQGVGAGDFHSETLLRQVEHHRPILSTYVSRINGNTVADRQADREFMAMLKVQAGQMTAQDTVTSAALDWPGFRQRYNIGAVRIPLDSPTSASLQQLANAMGQWHWRTVGEQLTGTER